MSELVNQWSSRWESSQTPPDLFAFLESHPCEDADALVPLILADQQNRWQTDTPLPVEDYLARLPQLAEDASLRIELAVGEFTARRHAGQSPQIDEYSSRFGDLGEPLRQRLAEVLSSEPPDGSAVVSQATQFVEPEEGLGQLGRYRLRRVLGEGAFGRVYLAFDEELERQVAIKVPTEARFQSAEDAQQYLDEARTVAALDHPHIVPVYDMGRADDGSVYVVSKYIEGETLEDRIGQSPPDPETTARWLATVARALHHAHQRRLVHRDVKPGNILLEGDAAVPYVTDFGLAIREEDYLRSMQVAGTPAYMSPEQARGEGHRLDGRSDIFSLGVILYECLTGRRPFRGSTPQEMAEQVMRAEPDGPRTLKASIPAELERICLRALAGRASDRYQTAAEMAEDLQRWDQPHAEPRGAQTIVPKGLRSFDAEDAEFFLELLPGPRDREGLPESLRFWKRRIEATDADQTFSVGLIYGPSGCGKSSLVKAGLLPRLSGEVIPVYVEATPEETETRILRGLGKAVSELPQDLGLVASFAWLRRRDPDQPKVVLLLDQFEQWLHTHGAEPGADLVAALRHCDGARLQAIVMVRDDFAMAAARLMDAVDVPIVQGHNFATVDLFDVAHARKILKKFGQAFGKLSVASDGIDESEDSFIDRVVTGLADDGKVVPVQIALFAEMVKSRPWQISTLDEVGGTEGIGVSFLEETFAGRMANPSHKQYQRAIRQVLAAMLPEVGSDLKGHMRSHDQLVEVAGCQDRPAAFRDVVRILDGELRLITPTDPEGDSPGTDGAGIDSEVKAAAHRYYQLTHDYLVPPLRRWLTQKKQESARGRAELRLAERSALWNAKPETRHLPSLGEWLRIRWLTDAKSWRGPQRAMMRHADRVHVGRAGLAAIAAVLLLAAALFIRGRVNVAQDRTRVAGLVDALMTAEPSQLMDLLPQIDADRDLAASLLIPLANQGGKSSSERRERLHARLALVSMDETLVDPLLESYLTARVNYLAPLRERLRPYASELNTQLWTLFRNAAEPDERRFRAGLALAEYAGPDKLDAWREEDFDFLAGHLVGSNAEYQPLLRDALRPIRERLLPDLERLFADPEATDAQRLGAANAFADYASSDVERLTQLLTVATAEQFGVLFPLVAISPSASTVKDLSNTTAALPPEQLGSVERIAYGQRRANAAISLLRLGERERVLPVFDYTDDPEALTQFIFRCRERGVGAEPLLELLDIETRRVSEGPALDISSEVFQRSSRARYALLLALGEFQLEEIPETRRTPLLEQLADWYANDPSSGVHGAAGWLLRQWGQTEVATRIDQTPLPYSPNREWFTLAITVTPTQPPPPDDDATEEADESDPTTADDQDESDRDQKTNSSDDTADAEAGQPAEESVAEPVPTKTFHYTFIVLQAGEYKIGSVGDEPDPQKDEERHSVVLTRPFAILDREVTCEELIAFKPVYAESISQYDASPDDAGFGAHWYDAVAFSRWLGQQMELPEDQQAYAVPDSLDRDEYPREPNPSANWAPRDWPINLDRRGFRLPTEAEWEVAARSGARTAYGYGSEVGLLERFGWFTENSGKEVHPPKERRPNGRGLFDMHGNLYEWTHDWYTSDLDSASSTDPIGPSSRSARVNRGGSFGGDAAVCRSANRDADVPTFRALGSGVRLALSLSGGSSPAEQRVGAEPAGAGTQGASAEQRPEMP